ncbi:MAG: IS30 family transposase [Woeseiaceae bacterium]
MSYAQLGLEERYQIYDGLRDGRKQSAIARYLGRSPATICREIRRNRGLRGYRPLQAHSKALARRLDKGRVRLTEAVWNEVDRLINLDWSPELISKRFCLERNVAISHEWIYQHVYQDKQQGGRLYRHLRQQKPRRRRYGKYGRRSYLLGTRSIEERPKSVESRRWFGHWEGDTMIGKGKQGGLLTLVERKARYLLASHLISRHGEVVRRAVRETLMPVLPRVKTITYDNGREFAGHKGMENDLGAKVYFAHPFSSWERGTSEQSNGLLRQYFPKKRSLAHVSAKEIAHALDRLNHRPRKCLGYRTPHEVFFGEKHQLTVALTS